MRINSLKITDKNNYSRNDITINGSFPEYINDTFKNDTYDIIDNENNGDYNNLSEFLLILLFMYIFANYLGRFLRQF